MQMTQQSCRLGGMRSSPAALPAPLRSCSVPRQARQTLRRAAREASRAASRHVAVVVRAATAAPQAPSKGATGAAPCRCHLKQLF